MTAKLVMRGDLCKADEQDTVSTLDKDAMVFMMDYGMGHLPLYKGYEFMEAGYVPMPKEGWSYLEAQAGVKSGDPLPETFSLMVQWPKCFPGSTPEKQVSAEVMRNQGQCGSCWSFGGGSSLANNLCTSKNGDQCFIGSDRLEISIQGILACNDEQQHCNGGNMGGFDSGLQKTQGPGRDRDFPYKANQGSCSAFPGRKEQALKWKYSGFTFQVGEQGIMKALAWGYAQYVSFKCGSNFQRGYPDGAGWKVDAGTSVYVGPASGGGHAVTLVAYGKTAGGMKYWRIQNSWGERWADGGYGNFERGKNLGDIDVNGAFPKGWVEGGRVPPCYDGQGTGLTMSGKQASCEMVKAHCDHDKFGKRIKAACPVVCKSQSPCNPGTEPAYSKPTTSTTTTTKGGGGGEGGNICAKGKKKCQKTQKKACKKACKKDKKGKTWSRRRKAAKKAAKKCTKKCQKGVKKACKKACKKAKKAKKKAKKKKKKGKSGRRRRAV
eukprot:gnl/TRDRNA2_/TRDRNA2_176984_c0_seq1.p1 gnl/TRDRNA2_/TRDRNA2_176984_c0~~gnl/TRDRNA2_/TRDRNA2_176984_c0_seq1.p1  ORF type:complete len:528 (+),score=109.30 gnl/TRDRNA2_/TRDRNA2_176984_c0_seq1:110-1585(+)